MLNFFHEILDVKEETFYQLNLKLCPSSEISNAESRNLPEKIGF